MPIKGKTKKVKDEKGKQRDGFELLFTNDALEQLEQLKEYFEFSNNEDVVKLGISFLQKLREQGAVERFGKPGQGHAERK